MSCSTPEKDDELPQGHFKINFFDEDEIHGGN